jgi:hypothetical protein
MLRLIKANASWWRKPLVRLGQKILTAELAVLACELVEEEQAVLLNSRSRTSGVNDLVPGLPGRQGSPFKTRRAALLSFVTTALNTLYSKANVARGCPDLVIWHAESQLVRLVEVKCPNWDRISADQDCFMAAAVAMGVPVKIVEWEFVEDTPYWMP